MRLSTPLFAGILVLSAVAGPVAGTGGAAAAASADARTQECHFPVSTTDATGTEVTVRDEPQRVVTLAPSAAQTVWEVDAKERVVGVSQYASYLDGAETRANVSSAGQSWVDVETVVALEPDLVLAPDAVPSETVETLRDANLTVYKFASADDIGDVEEKTLRTGRLLGACQGARATVDWMERKVSTVREAVSDRDRPTVLYTFFGYTAGTGTFVHEVIRTAGGRNVAAMANLSGFTQISPEVVVKHDPHWLMLNDGATEVPDSEAYDRTYAVQRDQTVVVKEEHISQPAPRIVLAVTKLARTFHPEAYERAVSTANGTRATVEPHDDATTTDARTGTATDGATATTDAPTPGFGVVAALLAAVSAAFAARRD